MNIYITIPSGHSTVYWWFIIDLEYVKHEWLDTDINVFLTTKRYVNVYR